MSKPKTPPPPDRWPSLYSAERASWDDAQRTGSLIIPILSAVLFAFAYIFFFVYIHLMNDQLQGIVDGWARARVVLGVAALFAPLIVAALMFIIVSGAAKEFFQDFYKPPEDTNVSKLINLRLFGVIPLPDMLALFFRYPFVLINIKEVTEGKFDLKKNPAHWLGGPAILVILDGAGLYLQRGNQFSRTLGPGIAFLDRYETIKEIIDLRHQTIRSVVPSGNLLPGTATQIGGRTKDGIKIFFNVEATFQIVRPTPQKKKPDKPGKSPAKKTKAEKEAEKMYLMGNAVDSGDLEAIRKACESTTVRYTRNADDRKYAEAKWRDGVWGTVSGDLAKYITKHYLDELLVFEGPDNGDFLSSATATPQNTRTPKAGQLLSWQEREKLRQSMDNVLRSTRGITLTDLRIVDFEMPPEVNEQRLQVQAAETQSRVKRIEGRAAAENILIREDARTRGQQELIASFADSLEGVDPENFADSVLLSLSDILSQSMDDPMLSANLAKDTFETLKQLREFLNQKEQPHNDSTTNG